MLAVGPDAGEGIHRFVGQRTVKPLLDQLGKTQDGGEWGSQFMAHVGDKLALVLARNLQVLDRFGKLPSTCLDLLEQSCVLDGDDGLVGEGGDQRNLRRRIWSGLPAQKTQDPDRLTVAKQRHGQLAAKTQPLHDGMEARWSGRIFDVGYVDHPCLHDGSTIKACGIHGPRVVLAYHPPNLWCARNKFYRYDLPIFDRIEAS